MFRFNVGDKVYIAIDVDSQYIDGNNRLRGNTYTIDDVDDNGNGILYYRLKEENWWVWEEACIHPGDITQDSIIARKIAVMYQRFENRKARK